MLKPIEVDEDQVLFQHQIPALEGDFLQRLGQRDTRVLLTGVLTGSESKVGLETLRKKFQAVEPISFVADITTATKVDQVLIEELKVLDLAGKEAFYLTTNFLKANGIENPLPTV